MLKRKFGVPFPFYLDHESYPSLRAAERERLSRVPVGDSIHMLEIGVWAALEYAATKLGCFVGIAEIDEGECDPTIAPCVLRFERSFSCTDQDVITLTSYPNRRARRRAVRRQSG